MRRCLFLHGLTCAIALALALRELAVALAGHETAYVAGAGVWLLAFAVGSLATGRILARGSSSEGLIGFGVALCGVMTPATLVLTRVAAHMLLTPGDAFASAGQIALFLLASLGPSGILLGAVYAVLFNAMPPRSDSPQRGTSLIHSLMALGFIAGGAAFSLLLWHVLSGLRIALLIAALNCMAAFFLWWNGSRRAWAVALSGALVLLFLAAFLHPIGAVADFATRSLLYPGRVLTTSDDTRRGRVDVVAQAGRHTFYESGAPLGASQQGHAAEEAVLLTVLAMSQPRRVLIVGGGALGIPAEALRCTWLQVDYIEPDGGVVAALKRHGPSSDRAALASPRLRVIEGHDVRQFMSRIEKPYDAIICAVEYPLTGAANRFYTRGFFGEARSALVEGGILCIRLDGPPAHVPAARREITREVETALDMTFPASRRLPTDNAMLLMASTSEQVIAQPPEHWILRLQAWRPDAEWVTPDLIRESARPVSLAEVTRNLPPGATPNTDLRPAAYRHPLTTWAAGSTGVESWAASSALDLGLGTAALGVIVIIGLMCMALCFAPGERGTGLAVWRICSCAAAGGFAAVLILAYQSFTGCVYADLPVLLGVFLLGTAGGALAGARLPTVSGEGSLIALLQVILGVLAGVTAVLLKVSHGAGPTAMAVAATVMIPLMGLIAGVVVGAQQPLCMSALTTRGAMNPSGPRVIGLTGACAGALIFGVVLVPVLGLPKACLALAVPCVVALPVLLLALRRR